MKSESKGKAVGDVQSLRCNVIHAPNFEEPKPDGGGPKGNPSSAGGPKPKRDANRKGKNKGRK